MNRPTSFKIVLLGEGSVGKTSLVLRYTENLFNDKHIETQQAAFKTKKLTLDGRRVELNVWDTAGQERYQALGPLYYRDANGALLVFDITDEDSFDRVKRWIKELKKMLGNDIVLSIVGNKIDLEKDRQVPIKTAEEYAKSVNAKLYHTSAKLNKGVEELFTDLATRMLATVPPSPGASSNADSMGRPGGMAIKPGVTNNEPTEKKSCC